MLLLFGNFDTTLAPNSSAASQKTSWYTKRKAKYYPELPSISHKKSGVRSLDHSKFFDTFAIVLERERNFYMQAFAETGPAALRNYLYELYLPALRNDITIIWLIDTYPKKTSIS